MALVPEKIDRISEKKQPKIVYDEVFLLLHEKHVNRPNFTEDINQHIKQKNAGHPGVLSKTFIANVETSYERFTAFI